MEKRISILVPVYNVEKYVARCLDSLVNQTYRNIEIIVVDDCGSDNSIHIAQQYSERDLRIRIIKHDCNRGSMVARQSAINESTGDYIVFCDSDDWLPLDAIRIFCNSIQDDEDLIIGCFQRRRIHNDCNDFVNSMPNSFESTRELYKALLTNQILHSLCAKMFRSSLLKDYDYDVFDNCSNGEDALYFYQIVANVSKVRVLNEVVYNYYLNNNSITQSCFSEKSIESIQSVYYYQYKMFRDDPLLLKLLYRKLIISSANLAWDKHVDPFQFVVGTKIPRSERIISIRGFFSYLSGFDIVKCVIKMFTYRVLS